MKCILDTNVFNQMMDDDVAIAHLLPGVELIATHIQWDELSATKNDERRCELQDYYREVLDEQVATEAAAYGVSRYGQSKYSDGESYNEIKNRLDQLNNSKPNNVQDALIADTARIRGFVLVTHDQDLKTVAEEMGIECKQLVDIRVS